MTSFEGARLVVRVLCAACGGEGGVQSDDWVAFEEWRRRHPAMTAEDEDDLVERYFIEVCDYSAVPAMQVRCDGCAGSGVLDAEVPVVELVEFVLGQVERPALAGEEVERLVGLVKQAITRAAVASQGLSDGLEVGSWLRVVQEGAEALRSLGELTARRRF